MIVFLKNQFAWFKLRGLQDSLHRASLIFCHFLLPFGLRGALASLFGSGCEGNASGRPGEVIFTFGGWGVGGCGKMRWDDISKSMIQAS